MRNRLFLRILANSLLGAVLIFLWTRFINVSEVMVIIQSTKPSFLLIFLSSFLLAGILRGARLRLLLNQYNPPLKDMVMLTYLSQFLSFMIPVRAGEITKSVYLTTQYQLPFGKTVTWVFIDRLMDFIVVLITINTFLIFIPTSLPGQVRIIALIGLIVLLSVVVLAIKNEKFLKEVVHFLSRVVIIRSLRGKIINLASSIIEGLTVLRRHPGEIGSLLLLSIGAMLADTFVWFSVILSLRVDFGFLKTILGNSLAALTFLIPAAPGYVGSAEAAGVAVLSGVFSMPVNTASAVVVFFHILTVVVLCILGTLSLYFLKFDIGLVWQKIRG